MWSLRRHLMASVLLDFRCLRCIWRAQQCCSSAWTRRTLSRYLNTTLYLQSKSAKLFKTKIFLSYWKMELLEYWSLVLLELLENATMQDWKKKREVAANSWGQSGHGPCAPWHILQSKISACTDYWPKKYEVSFSVRRGAVNENTVKVVLFVNQCRSLSIFQVLLSLQVLSIWVSGMNHFKVQGAIALSFSP